GDFSLIATAPDATNRYIRGLWGFGDTIVATDENGPDVFRVNLRTQKASVVAGLPYNAASEAPIRPLAGVTGLWKRGDFFYLADRNQSTIYKVDARTMESSIFARVHEPSQLWGDDSFLYVTQPSDGVSKISFADASVSAVRSDLLNATFISGDS